MVESLLSRINNPKELRKLKSNDLIKLAEELRNNIIQILSKKEGHLGSSLGTVELTIALHYVFNTPEDVLVWDVGHQAYGHKILTGRRDLFINLREWGGISGFPKKNESEFDSFGTGHASTSLSAVLGMALANKIQGKKDVIHIAVIGDASIAAGMAFEALNHLGTTDANVLIILNDNTMSIDPSVGSLKTFLESIKENSKTNNNLFKALKINYSGPIDGHNIPKLLKEFNLQKKITGPRIIHVVTKKGKGFLNAELDQVKYHSPGKFDFLTGKLNKKPLEGKTKFQDVFGKSLLSLVEKNKKIVVITPAMSTGSGIDEIMKRFPDRCFDVGIAEQHAVTLSAGFANKGMIPYCVIYSTFLQRAYDQLIHDVAIQKLPVIFCVDRSGLVGHDGPTHHGVFDIAFLRCIPNLYIASPKDENSLRNLLYTAQISLNKPLIIRYPRGYGEDENWEKPFKKIIFGKGNLIKKGKKIAIISVGSIFKNVLKAINLTNDPSGCALYDLQFIKPLDDKMIIKIFKKYERVIVVEEGVIKGGAGSAIMELAQKEEFSIPIKLIGIPDFFIPQGNMKKLYDEFNLSSEKISKIINAQLIKKI
jgi:1-deoxy-D-xylulose-5-phosphate synthase